MSAEDGATAPPAPTSVEIRSSEIGQLVGRGGQVLKRLIAGTGCKIEIPHSRKDDDDEDRVVFVELNGSEAARRKAAAAIREVLEEGGEAEDIAARAAGSIVVQHGLEERHRQSWLVWRLTAFESEFGFRAEVGRRCIRLKEARKGSLKGENRKKVEELVQKWVQYAQEEVVELEVETRPETEPENAHHDKALAPLVDQHGVLLWVPKPEDDVVKVKVTGPTEPARDAALLIKARYSQGKFTASVLQVSGQVQGMIEEMAADFANDIRNLESEYDVRVKESAHIIWVVGENAEGVENGRRTLVEMLPFYLPAGFFLLEGIPQDVMNDVRMDSGIRNLMAKPDCAISFDRIQETAWICGPHRELVKKRVDEILAKWRSEHWDMDLDNYGVAMWLLGPQGSGQWMHRMMQDSGAKIKACPNALKVWVEGKPPELEAGKALVLDALKKLKDKQEADEANGGRTFKAKEVLSDVPPHMKAIMEKLALLEALKKGGKPPESLLRERGLLDDRDRSRSPRRKVATEATEVMEWNPATGQMEATTVDVEVRDAAQQHDWTMNKSRYEEVEEEEEDDQYLQYNEKQDCANKTINHAAAENLICISIADTLVSYRLQGVREQI
eukprot:CAMPEP_0206536324 /NCGR_PEP_ID=MMETSP0325_2-20121206/6684_1 /ASSEMBLY_ACC=CAM_ASM_000347 /TAXON_ID=2866 /ORGANISM="Crypthecodinium cohnii, Strain Seligo" /LENGTH=613 /DNA_ID=CAMNT_0054033519 /DNA_START=18 /DNA_END=1859 /DNA_ORIENTATION=+